MGLSREEAYRILGLPDGASIYMVRSHYKRLAYRYHPDKNPLNRDIALLKFQQIVNAYVRLNIDPDDCDQMKMKKILLELYAINEDILEDEYNYCDADYIDVESEELDRIGRCSELVPYSSHVANLQKGPYADVLQDFMIRSYMSGGRKSKPSVNMGVEKKPYASERAMEIASKHADELLKDVEQERQREEKRRQRNKKKKEARKRKKDQKPESDDLEKRQSSPEFVIDDSLEEEKSEEIHSVLADIGNELDMSSAFFARINSKVIDQLCRNTSSSSVANMGSGQSTENFSKGWTTDEDFVPVKIRATGSLKPTAVASTTTGNAKTATTSNSTASVVNPKRKTTVSLNSSEAKSPKQASTVSAVSTGPLTSASVSSTGTVKSVKPSSAAVAHNGSTDAGPKQTDIKRAAASEDTENVKPNLPKDSKPYKPQPPPSQSLTKVSSPVARRVATGQPKYSNYYGRTFQSELPPRLAKLAQSKGAKGVASGSGSLNKSAGLKKTSEVTAQQSVDISNNGETTSACTTSNDQYLPEAVVKNGDSDYRLDQSRKMAVLGNRAAKEGRFQDAVEYFTKAIEHYQTDHRYFGNRSFCYEYMKEYSCALQDANEALRIKEDWPKGYFRKAKAFVGLEKYEEAEKCFEKAVEFDPDYTDAKDELKKTQVKRLMSMGFNETLSTLALANCDSVQEAIDSLLKKEGNASNNSEASGGTEVMSNEEFGSEEEESYAKPSDAVKSNASSVNGSSTPKSAKGSTTKNTCASLWIGNINPATITEGMLIDAFKKCGVVEAVHILHDRYCAFVEFSCPDEAAFALEEMQNCFVGKCSLLLKYPDNPNYSITAKRLGNSGKKTGPVNGNECYFWRTTGCAFGSKCRFRHIPRSKGIDLKSVGHKTKQNGSQRYK